MSAVANPDEYIRNHCKIEWTDLGEGINGVYDPSDPDDVALLRFDIYGLVDGEWLTVSNASYCTQVPADTDPELRRRLLERLADEIADQVSAAAEQAERDGAFGEMEAPGLKRRFEELSWIDPSWAK